MGDRGRDVALRPLGPDDSATVAALIRTAFATLRVEPAPSGLGVSAEMVAAHLAAGGGGAVIEPGRACILWLRQERGLYVSRLAVHPAARGQGLAATLLRAAEAAARRHGMRRLWLSTRLAAEGNRRLFARFGFVEGEQHAHPGYAAPTYVEMEKQLASSDGFILPARHHP